MNRFLPGSDWDRRPATDRQIFTLHRLECFARGELPTAIEFDSNLTMLQAHELIIKALDQIGTNIKLGGFVTSRILSTEEWKDIQDEVASGNIYRGGLSEKEWDDLQREIYDDKIDNQ